MVLKTKKTGLALATTAAALLVSGCASSSSEMSSSAHQGAMDMGQCSGVNSCKGTSSCATSGNSCATQNSCKGKGWLPLTKKECNSRNGKFSGFSKKS